MICFLPSVRFFPTILGITFQSSSHYFVEKCSSPHEIAAVVDVSDSLAPSDFPEIKNFLKIVGNAFHVSEHASHMSVILAGTQIRVPIGAKSFGADRRGFPGAVDNLKPLGGSWNVHRALNTVRNRVFTIENHVRNFLPQIVLVITNGQQRGGERARNHAALRLAAKQLHDMNAHVYTVAIGNGVSRDELAMMVKNGSEQIYQVDSFKDLNDLAGNVARDICRKDYLGTLYMHFTQFLSSN